MTTVAELTAPAGPEAIPWAIANRDLIRETASTAGAAVLHCGEALDVAAFEAVRDAFIEAPSSYREAATPRTLLGSRVWSATDLPASQDIALHNESSYGRFWPTRLVFGCLQAPGTGGATTLGHVGEVYEAIDGEIRDAFRRRGWLLVRHYVPGFGVPWQTAFETDSEAEVLRRCAAEEIEAEWLDDGVLRTRQRRDAVVRHPQTGRLLWFNHVCFWHPSSLDAEVREALVDELGPDGLPFCTYYGDGEPIPDEVAGHVRLAYAGATIRHRWTAGDVVFVDNMLVAHGRERFEGTRRIVVGMGDDLQRDAPECRLPAEGATA